MAWKLIETAPRDGTTILVYQPPRPNTPPSDDDFSLVKWWSYGGRSGGEWMLAECGAYAEDGVPMNDSPTHWLRPEPPTP